MKKAICLLLAFVLVLGLVPVAALATETPNIVLSVDKTSVAAGEDIVLTVSLDKAIEAIGFAEFFVYYDSAVFERKTLENGTAIPGTAVSKVSKDAKDPAVPTMMKISISTANLTDVAAEPGVIGTITFTALQDIAESTATGFSILVDLCVNNSYADVPVAAGAPVSVTVLPPSVAVTEVTLDKTQLELAEGQTETLTAAVKPEDATDKTVAWTSSDETVATVVDGVVTAVAAGSATITAKAGDLEATCAVTVKAAKVGYVVTMPADQSLVVSETVTIPVTVTHTGDVATYNAFDMSFSYDASVLTLTSTELEGLTVTLGEGTVRVQGYGADRAVGTSPFSLTFAAAAAGNAVVTLIDAKVDISANAIDKDAESAILADDATNVNVGGYPVNLQEGLSGESVAMVNMPYTFSIPQDLFDYNVTITVGGVAVDAPINNGDGTFTIPAELVTGAIVITAEKTGKTFSVTLGEDLDGANTAQYMTDYAVTLNKAAGYAYEVTVTIGGNAYTGYSVAENVYTIPGGDITGEVVFTVTKTLLPPTEYNVTFEGTGAGDVQGNTTVQQGEDYSFRLIRAEGYVYTLKATINGAEVEIVDQSQQAEGVYSILAADITGNIVITVTKKADLQVSVTPYVELDGKTMFLVTAKGTLAEGSAYAYDGNVMFYSNVYQAWCYLVIGDSEFNVNAAQSKITTTSGTYVTVTANADVNGTYVVDINDAQLVYDIYNGLYQDFTVVSMTKFLNADVNGDKVVNVTDAAAVVAGIQ